MLDKKKDIAFKILYIDKMSTLNINPLFNSFNSSIKLNQHPHLKNIQLNHLEESSINISQITPTVSVVN